MNAITVNVLRKQETIVLSPRKTPNAFIDKTRFNVEVTPVPGMPLLAFSSK